MSEKKPTRKKQKRYDGDMLATKLRVVRVENLVDGQWIESWSMLGDAYRQASQLAHVGARCVADGLADLYEQGKSHGGKGPHGISPSEIKTLQKPMYATMRRASLQQERTITSGHVAAIAQDLFQKEFSDGKEKKKLSDIIHGKRGFPVPNKIGLPVRGADWWLEMNDRKLKAKKNKDGTEMPPAVVSFPVVYITSLFSKAGRVRLVCSPVRGRGSESKQAIINSVISVPRGSNTMVDGGPKRGTMIVKRVKKPSDNMAKWFVVLSYGQQKVDPTAPSQCAVVVHRGVAHCLMIAVVKPDSIQFHAHFGHEVVDKKAQFSSRRKRYKVDASAPNGSGRGRKHRFKKLRALGNAERNSTDTDMWRAARSLETVIENSGASTVILESMGTFRCDVEDDRGRHLPSYVRNWPYAQLKSKCLDVIKRRRGISDVHEVGVNYISQRCPACEHTSEDNIARLPKINASENWSGGVFRCVVCRFTRDLDETAIMNMIARSKIDWVSESVLAQIKKWKRYKNRSSTDKMLETMKELDILPSNDHPLET